MYIRIKVIAGAKKELIEAISEGQTVIGFNMSLREPAERNLANKRVLEIIRTQFPGKSVRMISGHHHPTKIVSVDEE